MQTPFRTPAARWTAVRRRDPRADRWFRYAVRTTGIYCRPTCPSRRARRENVSFHDSAAAAEAAGFRPCKRCDPRAPVPDARRAALVARMCRLLEADGPTPTLAELSRVANLSPFHLHRVFRATTGLTPRAWAMGARQRRLALRLADGGGVTRAVQDAGYAGSARAYAEAPRGLGMTPGQYAAGAPGIAIHFGLADSSLGRVLAAATSRGLCAILLGDDDETLRAQLAARFPRAHLEPAGEGFGRQLREVVRLVEQPARPVALAMDIQGTAFQQRVWQALRGIPAGETLSYAELAARIGLPGAARAVATACAANTLAVAIPCHRVVRGNGELSGYRWGPRRKRELLRREGATVATAVDGPVRRK